MGVAKKKQGMEIQGGTKVFLQFKKRGKVFEACLDGCQGGVIAPGNGLPRRKPWTIMSTDPHVAHCLDLRCDGGHPHTECIGHGRAVSSALYPPRMCHILSGKWG